ncbi:MAG TPA: DUF222 domain-containing protein [Streptosporangiaceae bacterium]
MPRVCESRQPSRPASAADAIAMARTGLAWLAAADVAALPAVTQGDCLRALAEAESLHLAARTRVLSAYRAQAGYEEDGHGSAATWLTWQTRVTSGAAGAAVAWTRRLAAHPAVATALAEAAISVSWAKAICAWSDQLPEANRADADAILLAAAAGGADLADLAALAQQIRARTAGPDHDTDGFDDRWLRLDQTLDGVGSLQGQLTARCRAALEAVLGTLGRKHGPEDTRSRSQRDHDALEEACRLLLAAGCLPARAGQPVQLQVHMTLDDLLGRAGAASQPASSAAIGLPCGTAAPASAAAFGLPAGPGDECDVAILPVVTGHLDPDVLDQLAAVVLRANVAAAGPPGAAGPGRPGSADRRCAESGRASGRTPGDLAEAGAASPASVLRAERAVRQLIVRWAVALLSGPFGLAATLRTSLPHDVVASVSLPLDVGALTETIPVHLRRAVTVRDPQCRFPGCDQPAAACQPHHIVPRSQGGPASLSNLVNLCAFHHLTVIHRWGWAITLHPDGTVTATSPDRDRVLRSHSPPAAAA